MCYIQTGVQNPVSDSECVTVGAFLAQDSDITKGLKVSEVRVLLRSEYLLI